MNEKKTSKAPDKHSKAPQGEGVTLSPEQMEAGKAELMKCLEGVPGAEKVAELLDKGKKKGKLSASEMMEVLDELNLESEQMDKLYDVMESLGIDAAGEISDTARSQVEELLKRSFRPEFLNRLDEIVFYKPLTRDNLYHIIDLQLEGLNRRLADKRLNVQLTDEAKALVLEAAYDPMYGARPLRRYLQHTVENLVGRKIIAGDVSPDATLVVDREEDRLVIL